MSDRVIFQNVDKVSDEVLAIILAKGLPEEGTKRIYTEVAGEIVVSVVKRRESRVYRIIRVDNPNLLIDAFADLD